MDDEFFGHGSAGGPLFVFGDAAVGPEYLHPELRRVGVGLVVMEAAFLHVRMVMHGPLPGRRQTVHRGELLGLIRCAECSSGQVVYVTDNLAVHDGWWERQEQAPGGLDHDLWWRLGRAVERRSPPGRSALTVVHVNSHLDAAAMISRGVSAALVRGNAAADEVAGCAAAAARLPAPQRARVGRVEAMATAVWWRLLRSTLDAVEATPKRLARARRPRQAPPALGVAAAFSTSHVLDDDGRTCRACRCSSSAERRTS